MVNDTHIMEEAVSAYQAVTGTTSRPNTATLVAWLLNRARAAETALQRASEAACAIASRSHALAEMIDGGLHAVQQGLPLPPPKGSKVKFAGWTLDTKARSLTAQSGLDIVLTTTEYEILAAFLKAPNKVLTRETIAELALGRALGEDDRTIDIQIVRLRRKLELDPKAPALIKTVYGKGYLFTQDVVPTFSLRRHHGQDAVMAAVNHAPQPMALLMGDGDGWILEVGNVEYA